MKLISLLISSLFVVGLSGCATPHACPLPANPNAHCASVLDTLSLAKKVPKNYRGTSIFEVNADDLNRNDSRDNGMPVYYDENGQLVLKLASPSDEYKNALPIARKEGMPIYRQAEPREIWLSPWTDANGVLHGDKEVYTLKPGGWNYGSMKRANAGSDVMGPVNPDDYGFDPIYDKDVKKEVQANINKEQVAKTQQKEEKKPAPVVVDNKTNSQKATATVSGITQPYQKFEE